MAGTSTLLTVALLALSDIIVLKNGNEIQGEVLKEEEGRVVVRFPGGILELQRKEVESIRRQPRATYLVEEGEKQVRRGDFDGALKSLEEAVREEPASKRAREALAAAREGQAIHLRDLGRYEESRAAFEALLRFDPAHGRARAQIRGIEETLAEAAREEERGRQELAGGDLETGAWRLQRIFDAFPDRRPSVGLDLARALGRRGDQRLAERSWEDAEALYLKALSIHPEVLPSIARQHTVAKVRRIEAILPSGEFAAIGKLAVEGLEVEPSSGALRYYHGLALEGTGKRRAAAEEYLSITGGKRPAGLEEAVIRLRQEAEAALSREGAPPREDPRAREVLAGDYREIRTAHFAVRHKNEHVAKDVVFAAERAYAEVFRDLGCSTHLRSPIRVQIYPDRDEYVADSGMASWSGGAHRLARRMGNLSDHRIYCYQGQPRLATGVLPHEVAHALLAHRLNYPDAIPLWANEGFAVMREPTHFRAHYHRILLLESARRTLLPLREVVDRAAYPEERIDLFYAQCFSLVEFLVSLEDLETFIKFLRAVSGPSADLDLALQRHYEIRGRQALENRWIAWLERSLSARS